MAGTDQSVMVVPYPPGIPFLCRERTLARQTVLFFATRSALEAFDRSFPGFATTFTGSSVTGTATSRLSVSTMNRLNRVQARGIQQNNADALRSRWTRSPSAWTRPVMVRVQRRPSHWLQDWLQKGPQMIPRRAKQPLIRGSVRPSGFEPETCGSELGHLPRSVVIRMSWSDGVSCPPMSVAIRSNLVLWLQKWLQIEHLRELGQLDIEVRSETLARIDFQVPDVD